MNRRGKSKETEGNMSESEELAELETKLMQLDLAIPPIRRESSGKNPGAHSREMAPRLNPRKPCAPRKSGGGGGGATNFGSTALNGWETELNGHQM